ncbi:unnamed protein product [Caenorhabditis angaria]|uniref:Innexin n=1 Tax=Caenorhabditis angaria TaxID=860376 RepID=A0A9P1I6A2_9PELO|nr:unnamed protein product [Caenorhabditis angaria]
MFLGIPIIGDFLNKSIHICRTHLYDNYDRLHFMLTAYILGFFVLLTGAKQHFGNPIDCMLSAEVDDIGSWKNYIHSYCLLYGTYRYTFNSTGAYFPKHNKDSSVFYYQWVPFFFAFQLLCFMLPHWIWTWMQKLLYVDMAMIVEHTNDLIVEKDQEKHKNKLTSLVGYVNEYFKYRKLHKIGYLPCIFMHPAFASFLYIMTKFMFLANVIIQLKLVSVFLDFDSWTWGFEMIMKYLARPAVQSINSIQFIKGGDGHISARKVSDFNYFKNFPILVACDYHTTPSINAPQISTSQCIIPLNIVNEKLFVGLWVWLIVLTGLTIIGTIGWIFRLVDSRNNERLIYSLLKSHGNRHISAFAGYINKKHMPDHRYDFVHKFLGLDGILLLHFMREECGVLKTQEVINGVYEKFIEDYAKPAKPTITKKGERTDYSEVNFGNDEEDIFDRKMRV